MLPDDDGFLILKYGALIVSYSTFVHVSDPILYSVDDGVEIPW